MAAESCANHNFRTGVKKRLKAKHRAELAVAGKMSSAKTGKAKKNSKKETTNATLATETKNLAPETTRNSSDEDEDSDLEEEKRKQFEKQKSKKTKTF